MSDAVAKLEVADAAEGACRFVAAAVTIVVLLLGSTVALNVVADPRNEFHTGLYPPLILDYGKEKLDRFQVAGAPELVILGSSRGLVLPPPRVGLPGENTTFNFAVPGARPDDYRLLVDYLVALPQVPKTVVLGLDDFAVSQLGSTLAQSASHRPLGGAPRAWTAIAQDGVASLATDYVEDSLRLLKQVHFGGRSAPSWAFGADGTGTQPGLEARLEAGTYDLSVMLGQHFDNIVALRYSKEFPVQTEAIATLDLVFERLVSAGIEVWVYLPPIHPQGLDRLVGEPVFKEMQQTALGLLLAHCGPSFHVYDFTSIISFGGQPDGFYDNYHLRPATALRLEQALADPAGDRCGAHG